MNTFMNKSKEEGKDQELFAKIKTILRDRNVYIYRNVDPFKSKMNNYILFVSICMENFFFF